MNTENKPFPKAGEVVQIEQFVHKHEHIDALFLSSVDLSEYGTAMLGSATVTFTMPNGDAVQSMVTALEKQIEKENADHFVKVNQLKGRIQELLAIGCDGGSND